MNGTEREILNINGLMAIQVDEGFNNIEFTYSSIYLKIGCLISIISLLAMVVWIKINKREKGEQKNEV